MWRYLTDVESPTKKAKTDKDKKEAKKKYESYQRERQLKKKWLGQFKWLRFDSNKESMYCATCRDFLTNNNFENHFIDGTNNSKIDSVRKHDISKLH